MRFPVAAWIARTGTRKNDKGVRSRLPLDAIHGIVSKVKSATSGVWLKRFGGSRRGKDAGIPEVTRHDLRQTGITRALLNRRPLVAVQWMAGHANLETMMQYYVQINRQYLRAAATRCREAAAV